MGRWLFEGQRSFRRWLDLCEQGRIDSVWQSDQVVSDVSSPEPLTLISVIAGATERLKIGTNAVVLPFRDPVTFARQCASLDHLSQGRLLLVVGVGATGSPAWRALGREAKGRGPRVDEALEVITRLWSGERASFAGDHYRLDEATISPRPVQDPLPLWIGGSSAAAVRRTVRFGTGWLGGLQTVSEAKETVVAIRKQAEIAGQRIPDDHYGATFLYRVTSRSPDAQDGTGELPPLLARAAISGSPSVLVERIRDYVSGGITKFVAVPLARSEEDFIEQTRLLDAEVLPEAMQLRAPY
jgi:probable F420-dependent oxidoreductase